MKTSIKSISAAELVAEIASKERRIEQLKGEIKSTKAVLQRDYYLRKELVECTVDACLAGEASWLLRDDTELAVQAAEESLSDYGGSIEQIAGRRKAVAYCLGASSEPVEFLETARTIAHEAIDKVKDYQID